uniref:Uncharacterized protein n=1 Tax=Meloidogyne enterolobii TaxID=390850 RepID=A0A6V7Y1C9_MELEN|nr:unnamed protein product [Meloidogyne enterolobii]
MTPQPPQLFPRSGYPPVSPQLKTPHPVDPPITPQIRPNLPVDPPISQYTPSFHTSELYPKARVVIQ